MIWRFFYIRFGDFRGITLEEAEAERSLDTPESLWNDLEKMFQLTCETLGERLPRGHSWQELAEKLHHNSRDTFFLWEIKEDLCENEFKKSKWAQGAVLILHNWKYPLFLARASSSSKEKGSSRCSAISECTWLCHNNIILVCFALHFFLVQWGPALLEILTTAPGPAVVNSLPETPPLSRIRADTRPRGLSFFQN